MRTKILKNKNLIQCIINNISIFDAFAEVYLFGSVLTDKRNPNDIDVFLIYDEYSKNISHKVKYIINYLEQLTGFTIDVTALSYSENEEIGFLNRLKGRFLQIK